MFKNIKNFFVEAWSEYVDLMAKSQGYRFY